MQLMKILTLIFLLCFPVAALSLPAFPGAEGFGSTTVGGRGGKVIHVTNLNDTGAGSFRAAVTASGPRIVVFDVSGYIVLQSQLQITEPYLTIAGQTSPGGICVVGEQTTLGAHDVIIRHMRFRLGKANAGDSTNDPNEHDSFDIWGRCAGGGMNAYNVIVDHCSFSWGSDETFTLSYGPHDITVQWSMIYEGLRTERNHSKGMAISQKLCSPGEHGTHNFSGHHNFFSTSTERNPYIAGANHTPGIVDWRNNVAYNYYGGYAIHIQDDERVNLVNNFVKPGPESNPGNVTWPAQWLPGDEGCSYPDVCGVYVKGNLGNQRTSQAMDEWCIGDNWHEALADKARYQHITPFPAPAITEQTMDWDYGGSGESQVANCIVDASGATAPQRDGADARIINEYHSGTGTIPTWKSYPADYPVLPSPAPSTDSDHDGMPDSWENSHGLNPQADDSAADRNGDGYTNIEEYINEMADAATPYNSRCMSKSTAASIPTILSVILQEPSE